MAVRTDVTVDWGQSPRLITVASPATEITIQDLVDTLRDLEDNLANIQYDQIISAAGKEDLGGGVQVGITATLLDALLQFEARSGPTYTQCNVSGGNLVAVDGVGVTQTTPISPTAFTQVVVTASSSATTQNQSNLEFAVYGGGIAVDTANGEAGTEFPIGTRLRPVNNYADAIVIGDNIGVRTFFVMGDATISGDDFSDHKHQFVGDSPQIVLTVDSSAIFSGSGLELLTVTGELDGLNVITNCSLQACTDVHGFIEKTAFQSTVGINGTTFIAECYSQVPGTGYPSLTGIGTHTVMVRDFHGSLGIAGMTGGSHSIEIYGGRLTIEDTCTGGDIYVRGNPYEINDLSGGSVTVVNQTDEANLATKENVRDASLLIPSSLT